MCYFVIGVYGKENHGTHYELVLNETQKHKLITPGHQVRLSLNPQEKTYLKFSFPKKSTPESKLYLNVDAIWGNFTIFISKENEFPNEK